MVSYYYVSNRRVSKSEKTLFVHSILFATNSNISIHDYGQSSGLWLPMQSATVATLYPRLLDVVDGPGTELLGGDRVRIVLKRDVARVLGVGAF